MGKKSFRSRKQKNKKEKQISATVSKHCPQPKTPQEEEEDLLWKSLMKNLDETKGPGFFESLKPSIGLPTSLEEAATDLDSKEVRAVLDMLRRKGAISYRDIPALMPSAAAKLSNGEMTALICGTSIILAYLFEDPFFTAHYQKVIKCVEFLTFLSFPTISADNHDAWQMRINFSKFFLTNLLWEDESYKDDAAKVWPRAFDSSCNRMEKELDEMFYQGVTGSFLKECPFYEKSLYLWSFPLKKVSFDDWKDDFKFLVDNLYCLKKNVFGALIGYFEGLEDLHDNCWECNVHVGYDAVKTCGSCQVALYCCKDCQIKAWNDGHKNTCRDIEKHYSRMQASFDYVDKIHFGRSAVDGVFTRPDRDYERVTDIAVTYLNWEEQLQEAHFDSKPSIQNYFKNLAAIQTMVDQEEGQNLQFHTYDGYDDFHMNRFLLVALAFEFDGGVQEFSENTHNLMRLLAIHSLTPAGKRDIRWQKLKDRPDTSQWETENHMIIPFQDRFFHVTKGGTLDLPDDALTAVLNDPHAHSDKELKQLRRVSKWRAMSAFKKIHKDRPSYLVTEEPEEID